MLSRSKSLYSRLIILSIIVIFIPILRSCNPKDLEKNSFLLVEAFTNYNDTVPTYTGSGFALENNAIITAYHVVRYSQRIVVVDRNNNRHNTTLVAYDERTDIAVLNCSTKFPTVELSYDSYSAGQPVQIAHKGIHENVRVGQIDVWDINYGNSILKLVQLEGANVDIGSSGGAVLDMNGLVKGMIVSKGMGNDSKRAYIVPFYTAKKVINQLLRGEIYHHSFLGIDVQDLHPSEYEYPGVRITNINNTSPNYHILEKGDIIQSINYDKILGKKDLSYYVFLNDKNRVQSLRVLREGVLLNVLAKTHHHRADNKLPPCSYNLVSLAP